MDQCCRPACPRPPALPPPSNDDGAKNASRYHFCAACLPIELKSLLTNGLLDSVSACSPGLAKVCAAGADMGCPNCVLA